MGWLSRFKRHPMVSFTFIYRGNESGRIRSFETTANIEVQAEADARRYLESRYKESFTLLASTQD